MEVEILFPFAKAGSDCRIFSLKQCIIVQYENLIKYNISHFLNCCIESVSVEQKLFIITSLSNSGFPVNRIQMNFFLNLKSLTDFFTFNVHFKFICVKIT